MSSDTNNLYEFGEYRLDVEKCLLWRGDEMVSLSPKALELLCLLVKRHGEVVSKKDILETIWSDTFVEEGVLTQNIYTLRQTLKNGKSGTQIIENIPRRGYRLTVPVKSLPSSNGKVKTAENTNDYVFDKSIFDEEGEEEILKTVPEKRSVFGRKSAVYLSAGLIFVFIAGIFGYLLLRRKMWNYFHPPLENVHFLKLTDTGNISNPALSPDGNFMAFVRQNNIYLKDINSGKDIKLDVPAAQNFSSLQFSPDGNSIYFRSSMFLRKPASVLQISRLGGEAKLVAEKVWSNFGLSPNGKQIAFIRNFPDQQKQILFIKNFENGKEREVLTRSFPDIFFYRASLAWSPDSKKIAFIANYAAERSTKLFVVNVADGKEEEIKTEDLQQFEQVAWLPESDALIASARNYGRKLHLWKIYYPNGNIQRVTNGLSSFTNVSISSDGKKLLAIQTEENSNLWIANVENLTEQKQITTGNSNNIGQTSIDWIDGGKIVYAATDDRNPVANLWIDDTISNLRQPLTANADFHSDFAAASKDGKFIYFNSNRGRLINIWRIDSNGENLTQITDGRDGLRLFPAVSPDGKFLYYIFRNRQTSNIIRLNLAENKEEFLFQHPNISPTAALLSLSPDGSRLLFINSTKETTESRDDENNLQFTIASTANPNDARFFTIKTNTLTAHFSPDGKSFDYLSYEPGVIKIMRQSTEEGAEPQEILSLPHERIFNFAWSKDGSKLAFSRGRQLQDAVLLTNFE